MAGGWRAIGQDARLAIRLFRRAPLTTAIALASISLSVGAAAVVFTAIRAVLIRPLPYARPGELVQLRTDNEGFEPSRGDWVFWDDVREISRRTNTLAGIGVYGNAIFDLTGEAGAPPEALYGLRVSAGLFSTLGEVPMLGRGIFPDEDQPGHTNEMVLSYGLWRRRFHADPGAVGRAVRVNGHDCLVVGVMPPEFDFPFRREAAHTPSPYVEFWAPLSTDPSARKGGLGSVARLRPGVSLAQAREDLGSIGKSLAREYPATNRGRTFGVALLRDRTVGGSRNGLAFLMGAAVLFLAIGCANVANLLLARGLARRREIAIRVAIGATPRRIVSQLLTESCILGSFGGAGGYLLAVAAWRVLPAVAPASVPRLAGAHADGTVLGFALAVALLNGVLFGLAPALQAARLKSEGRNGAWLVGAEVALSVVLLALGGQVLSSFASLLGTDPGFEADRVIASVVLPARERYRTPEERGAVYRKFLEAVRAIPGVESAGTVDALPFSGENHGGLVGPAGAGGQVAAEIDVVGGDYLQAMGIRLAAGRFFRDDESGAAIVNDAAAGRLWPGKSALGQALCVDCTSGRQPDWKQVVGVVSSVRHASLDGPVQANVYLSGRAFEQAAFLVARTNRPDETGHAIRLAIAGVDPEQPVLFSAPLRQLVADSVADRRFILMLLGATSLLALAMCVGGVYGAAWHAASRRTKEIGIRIAIGATPGAVQMLICRQGMVPVIAGLASGLPAALVLQRVLGSFLVGLERNSLPAFWTCAGAMMLAAGGACWVPARRAAKGDPLPALREE